MMSRVWVLHSRLQVTNIMWLHVHACECAYNIHEVASEGVLKVFIHVHLCTLVGPKILDHATHFDTIYYSQCVPPYCNIRLYVPLGEGGLGVRLLCHGTTHIIIEPSWTHQLISLNLLMLWWATIYYMPGSCPISLNIDESPLYLGDTPPMILNGLFIKPSNIAGRFSI